MTGNCKVCHHAFKKGEEIINISQVHKFHVDCTWAWIAKNDSDVTIPATMKKILMRVAAQRS